MTVQTWREDLNVLAGMGTCWEITAKYATKQTSVLLGMCVTTAV